MKFEVKQEVRRYILWDDGKRDPAGSGYVVAIKDGVVTCEILVDQYRPMKFRVIDGRATKFLEGIKDEWIEPAS